MPDTSMTTPHYTVLTARDRNDLITLADPIAKAVWPEFMLHDPVANTHWGDLYSQFSDFQFALIDPKTDAVMATGNSIPLAWDDDYAHLPDDGWDWALDIGFKHATANMAPTVLCALCINVSPDYKGRQLGGEAVKVMKDIAARMGYRSLIAPVRPSFKEKYPHTPMRRYLTWTDSAGIPKDHWLGVHVKLGGEIIKVCSKSMIISGSIQEWEEWTGMQFPGSDVYIVPGALTAVKIDWDKNIGTYTEPNVWVVHRIET